MPPQQQPAALRLLKGRGHGTDSGGRRGVDAAADAAQMVDVVASWDHTDEDPVGKAMCCQALPEAVAAARASRSTASCSGPGHRRPVATHTSSVFPFG